MLWKLSVQTAAVVEQPSTSVVNDFLSHLSLLLTLLLPLVLFALIVHWLEQTIQGRLSRRFGWNSVLWTGWLGTPIHESSHALMCALFRHRIDEVAFFEPDRQSGRLGYVRHAFRKGNWFEELGNVFIAIAPLIGGGLALLGLLWLFYPGPASSAGSMAKTADNGVMLIVQQSGLQAWQLIQQIVTLDSLQTPRFWVFAYLVLCVGSHMAPSESDYAGTGRGGLVLATILLLALLISSVLALPLEDLIASLASLMVPLFAVLGLTVVLCLIATGLAVGLTSFLPGAAPADGSGQP